MEPTEILKKLALPFEASELKTKPGTIRGDRAMVLTYVDARCVMERLDDVLGFCWQDEYKVLKDGVVCRLTIWIDQACITRCDVGSYSEQPDDGDKLKAAFSDALKRAAVKFGIGRYLYSLPTQWRDYDTVKRRFKSGQAEAPPAPAVVVPPPADTVAANRKRAYEILSQGARQGYAAFALLWETLPLELRLAVKPDVARLKELCAEADARKEVEAHA